MRVLLSTYNGASYIDEQIQTILNQKYVNVYLAIRDDGSTDNTIDVLNKYKSFENVEIHTGENIGYKKSFLWLLNQYKDDSNFFSFSDQDDYWLENKLFEAIKALKEFNENDYNLYFSNLIVTDRNLNKIGVKEFTDRTISLGSSLSRSNLAGCSMVFNKNIAQKVSKVNSLHDTNVAHDTLVQLVALTLNGNIYYDKNSYILFRRHEKNTSSFNKSKLKLIKNEIRMIKQNKNSRIDTARILLNTLDKEIPLENQKLLENVLKYKKSLRNKLSLLSNKNLLTTNYLIDTYTKLKIISGHY